MTTENEVNANSLKAVQPQNQVGNPQQVSPSASTAKTERQSSAQLASGSAGERTTKIEMRGKEQEGIAVLTATGIEYERKGDLANAERSYREAVSQMAEPMNDLAWLYYQSGRSKDALGLATMAVQLRPDEPRYQDTLGKVKVAVQK